MNLTEELVKDSEPYQLGFLDLLRYFHAILRFQGLNRNYYSRPQVVPKSVCVSKICADEITPHLPTGVSLALS